MLKKGQVYKLTYSNIFTLSRNYMILSPTYDVHIKDIKRGVNLSPIFHLNLAGELNHYGWMGTFGVIKIEKPNTVQDFKDIKKAMERYGMTYNRKLNKIEGYGT